jgi:RHS repeat-associated protein
VDRRNVAIPEKVINRALLAVSPAAREYDSFGTIIPHSLVGTWPGRFGYQGQSWLEISSANGSQTLSLTPTRIYDPVTGRFLQNEPILRRRPFAHYLYALQNPVTVVDPMGMQEAGGGWMNPYGLGPGGGSMLGGMGAQQSCKVEPPKKVCDNAPQKAFDRNPSNCGSCSGTQMPDTSVRDALLSELAFTEKMLKEADGWWRWGGSPEIDRYKRRISEINTLLQDNNGQIARLPNAIEYASESGDWDADIGAYGLIPAVGSGLEAAHHFKQGNVGRGVLYSALAISDVFLLKSLVTAAGKLSIGGFRFLVGQSTEGASHVAWEVGGTVYHGVTDTAVEVGLTTVEASTRALEIWRAAGFRALLLPVLSKELAALTVDATGKALVARNCAVAAGNAFIRGGGSFGILPYSLTHGTAGVINWITSLLFGR